MCRQHFNVAAADGANFNNFIYCRVAVFIKIIIIIYYLVVFGINSLNLQCNIIAFYHYDYTLVEWHSFNRIQFT